jgi:hypothetical protein
LYRFLIGNRLKMRADCLFGGTVGDGRAGVSNVLMRDEAVETMSEPSLSRDKRDRKPLGFLEANVRRKDNWRADLNLIELTI